MQGLKSFRDILLFDLDCQTQGQVGEWLEIQDVAAAVHQDILNVIDHGVPVAGRVGLQPTAQSDLYDVVIIGGGVSGLAAAATLTSPATADPSPAAAGASPIVFADASASVLRGTVRSEINFEPVPDAAVVPVPDSGWAGLST